MPTGFIQLITNNNKSVENDIVYKDPQITFFKAIYRRHTNFIIDNSNTTPKYELENVFPIEKKGDLVYNPILKVSIDERVIELGNDYNNYYTTNNSSLIYNTNSYIPGVTGSTGPVSLPGHIGTSNKVVKISSNGSTVLVLKYDQTISWWGDTGPFVNFNNNYIFYY